MRINRVFLSFLFVGFLGLLGVGAAAAEGTYVTPEHNKKYLGLGIKLAEAALEHAKQGRGKEASANAKQSLKEMKEIDSEIWAPKLQSANGRIRLAAIKAKRGDVDKAVELLETALVKLKKIQ